MVARRRSRALLQRQVFAGSDGDWILLGHDEHGDAEHRNDADGDQDEALEAFDVSPQSVLGADELSHLLAHAQTSAAVGSKTK